MTGDLGPYDFMGRCGLSHVSEPGHWNVDVAFRLRYNRKKTRWWYEADCWPGKPQPEHRLFGRGNLLNRLNTWPETAKVLAEYGVALPMAVNA